ncbi:MAG: hypothetical protein ARM1_0672 [Candidatus Micrarchaeota archaeon]|nr:MAG: hypothetical protein ARM1_0672 [Candidatus Micrarchaeota archaeon]
MTSTKATAIALIGLLLSTSMLYIAKGYTSSNQLITATANVLTAIYAYFANNQTNYYIGTANPNAINSNFNTNSIITIQDRGGNVAGNIIIYGGNWINQANNALQFGVSNTIYDSNKVLSSTPTDTGVIVPAPTIQSYIKSNTITISSVSVPPGYPAGNYTQQITFYLKNYTYGTTSNQITANVIMYVNGVCYLYIYPNTISFNSLAPGHYTPVNSLVSLYDNGGNTQAQIFISGGNWINQANNALQFGVSNTTYNSIVSSYGTPLTSTPTPTGITLAAPSPTNPSTSNSIYFGLHIPYGTYPGYYKQQIYLYTSC